MKYSHIHLVILCFLISCKEPKTEIVGEKRVLEKQTWLSAFSSLEVRTDKKLNLEDINNLDKINGFRGAQFNSDLENYSYNNIDGIIVNYNHDKKLSNCKCGNFNHLTLLLGSHPIYSFADGTFSMAQLIFLDNKLKSISIDYFEKVAKNGFGNEININKDDYADPEYSKVSIFKVLKSALGNPTSIYTTSESSFSFVEYKKSISSLLNDLDKSEYHDVKLIWETEKIYYEIKFDADKNSMDSLLNEKEKFKIFKIKIHTHLKEKNLKERIDSGAEDCISQLQKNIQNAKNNTAKEQLKSF